VELLPEPDQRVHDLDERRLASALLNRFRARAIAHLHLVDLRPLDPEPAAAGTEHRIRLGQRADSVPHPLVCRLLERRQELVQSGSSSRIVTGSPAMTSKMPSKSPCWIGSSRSSASRLPPRRRRGSSPDEVQAVLAEEHVLGAAEPMPWAPNSRAFAESSGLSAFARTFRRRTSSAHRTPSRSPR
jgi:hypothetical protein